MKYNRLSFLSIFIALGFLPLVGDAAIRVGNAARNNAQGYQQVNTQRYQAEANAQAQEQQPAELPINVTSQQLAQQIQSGDTSAGVTVEDLERCSMIYPNGQFEWARPTIGMQAGGAPTCTAVVELRAMGSGQEYILLARANLAAGDSFDCNVSNFPQATLFEEAGTVEFPADAEPTVEDVVAVMNEEQKQNAAIKIISGAVLGGLGGNVAGKNEVGKDGILGGGKDKIVSSVIGAVGGAGLMAASSYSGKVAGDMILSTGVNAAAGAVIGNIVTDGDSVMRIEKCKIDERETTCLWGYIEKVSSAGADSKRVYVSVDSNTKFKSCSNDNAGCQTVMVGGDDLNIKGYNENNSNNNDKDKKTFDEIHCNGSWRSDNNITQYCLYNDDMKNQDAEECNSVKERWVEVENAKIIESKIPAMIADIEDATFGYKKKDWATTVKRNLEGKKVYKRNSTGEGEDCSDCDINDFVPVYLAAEDGGVIDIDNKARMKGTLTGAGIGGAAGAFTAYQGAQTEIDARWVAAVREYKDSLQKFYCGTGKRFLSFYNDVTMIPHQN